MNQELDFTYQVESKDITNLEKHLAWRDLCRRIDVRLVVALNEFRRVDPNNAVAVAQLQERIRVYHEMKELPSVMKDELNINDIKENYDE